MDTTAPPGFIQAQPPPVMVASQQQPGGHHSGGHFGPVIGVLAVIAVLGILAGLVGRLCSGRTIWGYGPHFDVEAWVESKCSSCLDGHVPPRQPPQLHPHMAMESHPTVPASGGWRPQDINNNSNNVSFRPPLHSNQFSNVMLRPPPPQPHPGRGPGPRSGPNPEMEVHLRPLPIRQQVQVGEMRGNARVESEIKAAEERDDRQPPVNGVVEDEDEEVDDDDDHDHDGDDDDEMSECTDHDELQHRRRGHHQGGGGDEEDETAAPHQHRH